ncbi:MAG: hypothetical protein LC808_16190 [Actinobacteria bacterium]|nr:hypothetical protein [Actinomycetota bacterium]
MKLTTAQVGRAGEFFVAAEIHRRGGYAVTFAGNMPGIDILASDVDHTRQITLQVKTRTSGTWHAQVPRDAEQGPPVPDESAFWGSSTSPRTDRSITWHHAHGCAMTSTRHTPRSSHGTEDEGRERPAQATTGSTSLESRNGTIDGTFWAFFRPGQSEPEGVRPRGYSTGAVPAFRR